MKRWAVATCLALASFIATAQSEVAISDTVVYDMEEESDTSYATASRVSDTVIYRSTPDSTILRLQQMKEFAYANDPEYWKKKEVPKPKKRSSRATPLLDTALEYLFFGIFIVVLVYVLFRLLSDSKILLFKRKSRHIQTAELEQVINEKDLSNLITEAEQQEQYRLAARYRYMQLLEELNTRHIIRTHSELTNWDYIRQMGTHPLAAEFRYLTLAFDYVWYGEFELAKDQYAQLKNRFETFFH